MSEVSSLIEQGTNLELCNEVNYNIKITNLGPQTRTRLVISCGDTLLAYHCHSLTCAYILYVYMLFFDHIQRGEMALHIACRKGHDEVAMILLQAGADPNIQDKVSNLKW